MDSFFDTNIIINYSLYNQTNNQGLFLKCFDYIELKKKNFYICYRVLRELKNITKKLTLMKSEVLMKMKNPSHVFGFLDNEGILNKNDLVKIKRVYLRKSKEDYQKVQEEFNEINRLMLIRITFFIETLVSLVVILEENIKKDIVSILRETIENYTDCEILASAIQFQQGRDEFYFVTADKHFDRNGFDFINDDFRLEKFKFPILKNLIYS